MRLKRYPSQLSRSTASSPRAPLERGVIVAFRDVWHEEYGFSFKRVIALPGEEIEFRAHQVIIDGRVITQPCSAACRVAIVTGSDLH